MVEFHVADLGWIDSVDPGIDRGLQRSGGGDREGIDIRPRARARASIAPRCFLVDVEPLVLVQVAR